jgi:hypothetical protein
VKIGFFGDSYVDLIVHRWSETPDTRFKPWSFRLLEHYQSPIVNSGLGGSNQYHAINEWNKFLQSGQEINYAFFTFTWPDRLFSNKPNVQELLSLLHERRNSSHLSDDEKKTIEAIDTYITYIYDKYETAFNYELQVRWILELPKRYPEIKFVFLPNTEHAREMALKYFQGGILLDFAFANISALEGEIVGQYPFAEGKIGHLFEQNHVKFKNKMVDIIDKKLYNTIIDIDYKEFEL